MNEFEFQGMSNYQKELIKELRRNTEQVAISQFVQSMSRRTTPFCQLGAPSNVDIKEIFFNDYK